MKKVIATLTLALAGAACSAAQQPGVSPPAATPGTTSPSPSAGSPTATRGTTQVTLYYLAEGKNVSGASEVLLAPERHKVPRTQAIAKAALEELVHGNAQDPDHTTPFPRSARINSVVISAEKVATVDWSAEVLTASTGGGEVEERAIQSIVYTLTEFPSVSKVRFTVEGKDRGTASNGRRIEDFWGHVGLSRQPWDRDPAIEVLAPITLWTPLEGASSNGRLQVTGEASTFEANVGIILRDTAGRMVVQTNATATAGAPQRGSFSKTISFRPPPSSETWVLQVFESSAKDGSITFMEDRHIRVG